MGRTMGIREAEDRFDSLVEHVRAGDVITLTDHGLPVARVVPVRAHPQEPRFFPWLCETSHDPGPDRYVREDWDGA